VALDIAASQPNKDGRLSSIRSFSLQAIENLGDV
jgi:hypothetical protein